MSPVRSKQKSALLIVVACLLWMTDSVVRYPTSQTIDYKILVFLEHLFGFLMIAPLALYQSGKKTFKMNKKDLSLVLVLGVTGSSLGGIFFTKSIDLIGPSTAALFQMLQPILVVALAYYFLKEKQDKIFFQVGTWVILNALLLSLPSFSFGFSILSEERLWKGILLATGAMIAWGLATIAGKALLERHEPSFLVFWRWLICAITLFAIILIEGTRIEWGTLLVDPNFLYPLVFLGTVTGSVSMWIYYYGLKDLPASVATFIELIYALGGILLPTLQFQYRFTLLQFLGSIALVIAIYFIVTLPSPAKR